MLTTISRLPGSTQQSRNGGPWHFYLHLLSLDCPLSRILPSKSCSLLTRLGLSLSYAILSFLINLVYTSISCTNPKLICSLCSLARKYLSPSSLLRPPVVYSPLAGFGNIHHNRVGACRRWSLGGSNVMTPDHGRRRELSNVCNCALVQFSSVASRYAPRDISKSIDSVVSFGGRRHSSLSFRYQLTLKFDIRDLINFIYQQDTYHSTPIIMENHICIEHIARIEQGMEPCIEKRIDSIHSDLTVFFEMSSIIALCREKKDRTWSRRPFPKNSYLEVQSLDSIIYAGKKNI